MRPPPDFPASSSPLVAGGGLTQAAQENPVISVATRYLGVPYKWGGAKPKTGFDCSGLVQYVFAQLGVSLPHDAAAQYYSPDAVWIPPQRLQPGDLVFFTGSDGTRKVPGHVGIYVGDGYLIDAPRTGSVVRIDSLDERWFANKYVGAKRILGISSKARHLFHASKPIPSGFSAPIAHQRLGEPLGVAEGRAAIDRTAPRDHRILLGIVFCALIPLLAAGSVTVRRRHRLGAKSGASV